MLKKSPFITYGLAIFFCLSIGMLSGLLTKGEFSWYHSLNRPSFTPADWVFQPVWTVIYIIMGVILALLFLKHAPGVVWALFTCQFILNLLWTPIFFHFHQIGVALIDLSLLCMIIGLLMGLYRRNTLLFCLFLPYELWLLFALMLNLGFFMLNH